MRFEIDVNDCRDCPFCHKHIGHGEGWYHCIHPNHGKGAYGNILWGLSEKYEALPDWCPGIGKPSPVRVRPNEFVAAATGKEDLIGMPIIWAEWPMREER